MPYSHKCPVCDKSLEAESIEKLIDDLEQHLLEHVESKIELNQDLLEDNDKTQSRDFGEELLNPELLEPTDSDNSNEFTGMNFAEYDIVDGENYSEDEQYGKNYKMEDIDSSN